MPLRLLPDVELDEGVAECPKVDTWRRKSRRLPSPTVLSPLSHTDR
jgi:hypothetical protein